MRKPLKTIERKHELADAVSEAYSEVQALRDEMSEWRDNIEEKFSQTSKFEMIDEAVNILDNYADNEPDVPESLKKIEVVYHQMLPRSRRKGLSRSARRDNATMILQAVWDKLDDLVSNQGTIPQDDAESLMTDIETAKDEIDAVEFPGMFG